MSMPIRRLFILIHLLEKCHNVQIFSQYYPESTCQRQPAALILEALGKGQISGPLGRAEKSGFTDSRIRVMMVKTPSTVPKGMNRHSTPAITRQNV